MISPDIQAQRLLQQLAADLAMDELVESAACLLNAVLYLGGRDNYQRLTIADDIFLDHWIRDAVRLRRVNTIRCRWTKAEHEVLRRMYRDEQSSVIAKALGRPLCGVYNAARSLGLEKNPELIVRLAAEKMADPNHGARLCQFPKGHVPSNKGMRRPGWAPGRMAQTQFKPGQNPRNWLPIGSTRLMDGYLQRKVTDTGYPPRDWRGEHVLLWEQHHGPIPKGHALAFKDRDKTHIAIDNLELLSRGELMLRNTVHNLPKPLVDVIQLNGALKRKLRNMERKREEQDLRSA